MKSARGFTLIELLVTVTVLALIAILAAPSIGQVLSNARAREVVNRLPQDFSWARGMAANGQNTVSMTIEANCTWTVTVNGNTQADRSITQAELTARASGLSCAGAGGTALPVTFNFDATGRANASAAIDYTLTGGNTWRIQVLSSGSILTGTGAQ